MPDTTPRYAFPFQEATDPPDGASLGEDLALGVEDALGDVDDRLLVVEDRTTGKPLCMAVQTVAQNLVDGADTAITFSGGDSIDTDGMHDPGTNNTRFTPPIAGYYRLSGTVYMQGATTFNSRAAWFRKNGTTALPPGQRKANLVNSVNTSLEVETVTSFNGTSDYVELIANQDNTGGTTLTTAVATQFASCVIVEYLRAL